MITFFRAKIDTTKFNLKLRQYAGSAKKTGPILKKEMKVIVKRLVQLSPPFERFGSTSLATHKKAGENAIRKDFRGRFVSMKKMKIYDSDNPRIKAQFRKLLRQGDSVKIAEMLNNLGFNISSDDIKKSISQDDILKSKNRSSGRITPAKNKIHIIESGLNKLTAAAIKKVGKLKAGWNAAVSRFGVSGIPQWIARHPSPGRAVDGTASPTKPFVLAVNSVSYAGRHNKGNRLVRYALQGSVIRLEKGIKRKLGEDARRFNRR
jgi:uncharacterized protein YneF (UPF0154 family)